MSVINQMNPRPKLIVMDTMNFWMDVALEDLLKTLKMVDVLMINDSEARQLTGEYSLVKAAKKVLTMGPRFLIIKKGEHGAMLFHENHVFFAPALRWKMYLTRPAQVTPLQEALWDIWLKQRISPSRT